MVGLCSLKAALAPCDAGHFPTQWVIRGENSKGEKETTTISMGYPVGREESSPDRCLHDPSRYLDKLEQQQYQRETQGDSPVAVFCRQEAGREGTWVGVFHLQAVHGSAWNRRFSCSFHTHNNPPAPCNALALFQGGNLRKLGKCNGWQSHLPLALLEKNPGSASSRLTVLFINIHSSNFARGLL